MMPLCAVALALGMGESITFNWTTTADERWVHEAQIERPDERIDTGFGVMLFGGGLSADLHWTTPGSYEHEGQTHQLTIDGADTHDADTIADALLGAGFTVLRYSAIREGDPLHANNRAMAQAKPFPETVRMARAAWNAMLEHARLEPARTIVIAHSLGVPRSLLATDGEAGAYVMLAGAYVTPNPARPSLLADEAKNDTPHSSDMPDYDGSGDVVGWERAAARAIDEERVRLADKFMRKGAEFEWACDLLEASQAPALAIWGGLDPTSYHGPVLDHLLGERVETAYYPELGHNLGPEEDGRTGPIERSVVDRMVAWIASQVTEG